MRRFFWAVATAATLGALSLCGCATHGQDQAAGDGPAREVRVDPASGWKWLHVSDIAALPICCATISECEAKAQAADDVVLRTFWQRKAAAVRQAAGEDPPWPPIVSINVFQPRPAEELTRPATPALRMRPERYPPELLKQNVQGTVVMMVEVSRTGETRDVLLTRSVHPVLDAIALGSVEDFDWHPAEVDCQPVDSYQEHRFRFELRP